MSAYAAATLAVEAISSEWRRRRRGLVGEDNIIDRDDDGGGGGVGGKEASERRASAGAIFCFFLGDYSCNSYVERSIFLCM